MCSLPSATPSPSHLSSPPAQLAVQEIDHLSSPPAQLAVQEIDQTEIMDSQFQSDNVVHEDNSAYFDSLPPGYRFCPFDFELIDHYLQKKVLNQQLPINRIQEVELYNHEPEHLADLYLSYGEKEWYFFTPRSRKYPNGSRPKRAAGNGYWKATGADKEIHSNGRHVGFRKALVFYHGKPPKGVKSDWIMHEFRVRDESTVRTRRGPKDMKLDEWVLCKIYRKTVKSSREVHSTESQEEVEMQIGNVDYLDGYEGSPNNSNLSELVYGFDQGMGNYMGLINPPVVDESNHSLPYNLPPLPSDSYNLFADNFLPEYNINAGGHGDLFSSAEPISFMPPMQFTGGDFQPRTPATGPANDDYWGFKQDNYYMSPQFECFNNNYLNASNDYWGFKQDNYYMSPQFECFNNNYLNASNFVPVDEIFPNTTGKSPFPGDHPDTTGK